MCWLMVSSIDSCLPKMVSWERAASIVVRMLAVKGVVIVPENAACIAGLRGLCRPESVFSNSVREDSERNAKGSIGISEYYTTKSS